MKAIIFDVISELIFQLLAPLFDPKVVWVSWKYPLLIIYDEASPLNGTLNNERVTHQQPSIAMEAISGRKTIQEIAADHGIHLDQAPHPTGPVTPTRSPRGEQA